MSAIARSRDVKPALSAAQIPLEEFERMRRENLARWPTGALVDIDEAVAYHQALPRHKQLACVMREADARGRCLTQPRGGFGTLELQLELMRELDIEGMADIVPTTTDSYTRNEQWASAERGIEESRKAGRSMLNGFPMVNYGPRETRKLIEAIDKPAIVLSGTSFPKLTSEVGYAAGFSGYLGSGLAYTVSYTKETSLEEGLRNYQYLDRLAALYAEKGVELHRRQPGFLTGTNIPPSHRHHHLHRRCAAGSRARRAQLRPRARPNAASRPGRRSHPHVPHAGAGVSGEVRLPGGLHAGDLAALDGGLAAGRGAGDRPYRLRRHAGGRRRRGLDHHQVDARGVRHPHAQGQRRSLAGGAHGHLPRAQPAARTRCRSSPANAT